MYRFIPRRLLEDDKGCPTWLCWRIYDLEVALKLREPIKLSKDPFKFMWGDKEITGITEIKVS